jgi:hypothetical protein
MNKVDTSSNEREEGILKDEEGFGLEFREGKNRKEERRDKTGAKWHNTGQAQAPYRERFGCGSTGMDI